MNAGADKLDLNPLDFAPGILAIQESPPSPLPRATLKLLLLLVAVLIVWAYFGQLDIIAVAEGKLVPKTYLKIVQPAEGGILKDILVGEGDSVRAGQVLMRMDRELAQADTRILGSDIAHRRLQLARIDAELSDQPFPLTPSPVSAKNDTTPSPASVGEGRGEGRGESVPPLAPSGERGGGEGLSSFTPELIEQVRAQYHSHRRAYEDALAAEQAALTRAKEDMAAAEQVRQKLAALLPTYQQEEAALKKLGDRQLASKLEVIERQRRRIETEQDLKAQERNIESLKAAVTQSETQLAQIGSHYRQQLHNERIDTRAQLDRLTGELAKQQHRNTLLELKAPQNGIVKDLATHTLGAVVSPGTVLMTLVPSQETLQAEVMVRNEDIGFVHEGQRVKLKLAAYPFQKYGLLEGKVIHVSADAAEQPASESNEPAGHQPETRSGYKAMVELGRQTLERGNRRYNLSAGMQVSAEINQGTRTILEYLLSPVQKTVSEAGRER